MDLETAELVKTAANSFLATKISYINVMAEVCEASGADVTKLAQAIGMDDRIGGKFLAAGLGFGGGCLPKDIRAFRATAAELGIGSLVNWLGTVDDINLGRRDRVMDLARAAAGGDLSGKRVAVLGIAFKPNSDDIRDSPALAVIRRMHEEDAVVAAYDPIANANAAGQVDGVSFVDSVAEALKRADIVLHLTEWSEFRAIDPASIRNAVARPVMIDARCALDADLWRAAGWTVYAPGRP
jgi:UDPglucose 6-dehydrogenase